MWRFRLLLLLLLAVLVVLGFRLYQEISGATDQDPGVGAAPARLAVPAAAALTR